MGKSERTDKQLTIVIPVHNRAGIVVRTLDSIACQEGIAKVSLILVDDGSTDGSLEVMLDWKSCGAGASLDDVRLISGKENRGAAAARETGLRDTVTEWVMFFDSDDVMEPGLIAALLREIERGDAEIIGWEIDQQLPPGKRHRGRFTTEDPLWNHIIHGIMSTQRFAVATALARRAGGWDASVRGWNDYEFGMRLLLQSAKMVKLPGVCVTTYFTPDSITGRSFSTDPSKWEHSLDLCERSLTAAHHSSAWIDVRRMILAAEYRREGAVAEARRLRREVASRSSLWRRAVMNLLYVKHRVFRPGTGRLACLFLKKP